MRVLLACVDVFTTQGGGQTFFSEYIRANSHVEFFFFSTARESLTNLPTNAHPRRFVNRYRRMRKRVKLETAFEIDGVSLTGNQDDVYFVLDMAASVAGENFDAVEIPDFLALGALLPAALRLMGGRSGRVLVSMHGTISDAISNNWAPEALFDLASLKCMERALYKSADLRYGIGQPYVEQWSADTGRNAHLLDIGSVFDFRSYDQRRRASSLDFAPGLRPDLVFVGRQERWKGPDLFIDLASRLPGGAYANLRMIGSPVILEGYGSTDALTEMAKRRRLDIEFGNLTRNILLQQYAEAPWIVVIPSRHDTFNLSGLEAILSGSPIALSKSAGLWRYIREAWPNLPFISIDADDLTGVVDALGEALAGYGALRRHLCEYLDSNEPKRIGLTRDTIWSQPSDPDIKVRDQLESIGQNIFEELELGIQARGYGKSVQKKFSRDIKEIVDPNSGTLRSILEGLPAQSLAVERLNKDVARRTGDLFPIHSEQFLSVTATLAPYVFSADRIRVFDLLGKLERLRGNELLYATYKIRAMRLSKCPEARLVDEVASVLVDLGFPHEAQVTRWLYGPQKDWAEARAYLESVSSKLRSVPTGDIEKTDDRRSAEPPKASIIVSLYRAADKLQVFLDGLARMTERTRQTCEVILIDSCSPDGTEAMAYKVLDGLAVQGRSLNALYVRTSVRETIQRAWNRGLGLARAPYVAFLGCDEMNRPDAFDILVDQLDADPDLDWVQGTALVTEVAESGAFRRDIMAYDRTFDSDVVQLLDTCFVGYVGALYRKSVHDRVGYYDESFRGAGDTEFKNRALPFMKVKTLPFCLGFFLNYPDERVTASAAVEIEDLRAWYLHRSPAGVAYLFDRRGSEQAAWLASKCLMYRKSYMTQDSTDLELATVLHDYLGRVSPSHIPPAELEAVQATLSAYQDLDALSVEAPATAALELAFHAREAAKKSAIQITSGSRSLIDIGWNGRFEFINDNRSHQHFGIWPSVITDHPANRRLGAPDSDEVNKQSSSAGATHGLVISPSLTVQIVVEPTGIDDLTCHIDGWPIECERVDEGRSVFTRVGRHDVDKSWLPRIEFLSGNGSDVGGISAKAVIDLTGLTDKHTGDAVLSATNLYDVEYNDQKDPAFRWTGPGEVAGIFVPAASARGGSLELTIYSSGVNTMADLEAIINGVSTRLTADHAGRIDDSTVILPLPAQQHDGYDIRIKAPRTNALGGGDLRKLGVAWGRVVLRLELGPSIT